MSQHECPFQTRVQRWLVPPVQVQICALVPLAVPLTSRHLFAPTAVMLPSAFSVHFWFFAPLQALLITAVPPAAPAPFASSHLSPYTRSSPAPVGVPSWLLSPLQSHSCACAPLAWEAALTPRHRPDATPSNALVISTGGV